MKEHYLGYTAKEFVQDKGFKEWIVQKEHQQDWVQWLQKHPSKRSEVLEALALVETSKSKAISSLRMRELRAMVQPPQAQALAHSRMQRDNVLVHTPLDLPENTKKSNPIKQWIPYMAVACMIVPLAFFLLSAKQHSHKTVIADRGATHPNFTLPDGSIVKLNADSKLTYDPKTWDEQRIVNLDGEAFFEIKEGSMFTVSTTKGEVNVPGASFNVNARNEALEVACFLRSVQVKNKQTGEKMEIRAQEQIALNGQKMEKSNFDMRAYATWRKGSFYYQEKPVGVILEEIERQYNVHIKAPKALERQQLDFFFDLREPLDNTVENIGRALNVEVQIKEDTIILSEVREEFTKVG